MRPAIGTIFGKFHYSWMLNIKRSTNICRKGLVRWSSHYLSDKWSKEPFEVGYPLLSVEVEKKRAEIFAHLFCRKKSNGFDIYKELKGSDKTIEDWYSLNLSESNRYRSLANENVVSFVLPEPKFDAGMALYQQIYGLENKYYASRRWNMLSEGEREKFHGKTAEQINQDRVRIWKGYEVVEYLKRHGDDFAANPYSVSNLHPWEIIKDKLRRRHKPDAFEVDIYDTLIKEAFSRNTTRKAMHIFYTDIMHSKPQKYTYNKVASLFSSLPKPEKDYYHHKQRLRSLQGQKTRIAVTAAFLNYFRQLDLDPYPPHEVGLIAYRKWQLLPSRQKEEYGQSLSRIQKKELRLDWRMGLVMDYIFYTGHSKDTPDSYNWREDYRRHFGDLTYLHRAYSGLF